MDSKPLALNEEQSWSGAVMMSRGILRVCTRGDAEVVLLD